MVTTTLTEHATALSLRPDVLGDGGHEFVLWAFDEYSQLMRIDLETGNIRRFDWQKGGLATFGMYRTIAVFRGDGGTDIIDASGSTTAKGLGAGVAPIVDQSAQSLWTLGNDLPRTWQAMFVDGTVIQRLPIGPAEGVVPIPFENRELLIRSRDGTVILDLSTGERRPLTATQVVSVGLGTALSRSCSSGECALSTIDLRTGVERPLVPSIPGADAANASISPTGTFVAVTHKAVGQGRYAQIFSVTTGAEVWRSPDGISFTGIGPAWSWSPDGRWLFVTMSADEIIAARTDGLLPDARIKLTTAPLDGIAVTYR
ncbi:MAG TPA: hypothetical protein VGQ20_10935 [Acidimicrobiales bacterium]|nr:hypothetical protein [Acidimicrobiales bacterium]